MPRPNGFGNRSPAVAASLPFTSGAMLAGARYAIAHRTITCAPVSVFHHAHHRLAGAFCTFNGLMVAALALHVEDRVARVGILDCDMHWVPDHPRVVSQANRCGRGDMSENRPKLHAVLVIACAALALSIYAVVRGAGDAQESSANTCIDREARAQLDTLRRALAEREAVIARLARAANAPGDTSTAPEPSPRPVTPPERGPRRYVRFETPNPAVSVTQEADGTYDIHTIDPALAGSVMQVTAVTQSGDEDKLLIRIP